MRGEGGWIESRLFEKNKKLNKWKKLLRTVSLHIRSKCRPNCSMGVRHLFFSFFFFFNFLILI